MVSLFAQWAMAPVMGCWRTCTLQQRGAIAALMNAPRALEQLYRDGRKHGTTGQETGRLGRQWPEKRQDVQSDKLCDWSGRHGSQKP